MKALVKRILKATLPAGALNRLREVRNAPRFSQIPRQRIHETVLPRLSGGELAAMLASSDADPLWREDHQRITAEFGGGDRLGGVNPGDRQAIYRILLARRPRSVLEIGTHIGASTLHLASALVRLGAGRLTTVDVLDVNADDGPWRLVGVPERPAILAARVNCDEPIEFITSPALAYLRHTDRIFDFIFLDGDHAPGAVYQEVAAATRVLASGGTLLLHDFYPDVRPLFPDGNVVAGPFRALERITRENPTVTALPLGFLPWPTKQGSHATSLALVVRDGSAS